MKALVAFLILYVNIATANETSTPSSMCPENSVFTNGVCKLKSEYLCPESMTYSNGVCVSKTEPPTCSTPQQCIQPISCQQLYPYAPCNYQQTCPQNTILYGGYCQQQRNIQCPVGSTLSEGRCIRQEIEISVKCAAGFTLIGNTCVQDVVCQPGTVLKNGRCEAIVCEGKSFWYNGACVQCPFNSVLVNGRCIQCYDGSIFQNGTCVSVDQPSVPEPKTNQYLNLINITNIVNNTNIHNVVTKLNNTNINNINLVSSSQSGSAITTNKQRGREEAEEHCCIISEPRKCRKEGNKYKCFHRRHHVCGERCLSGYQSAPATTRYIPRQRIIQQAPVIEKPVIIPQQQVCTSPTCGVQPTVQQYSLAPRMPQRIQMPMIRPYSFPMQGCVQQQQWPFMSCGIQRSVQDCSRCQNTHCVQMCQYPGNYGGFMG